MGATNCPETPRQRMIGMMYLVLTAMLALNVSVDILNAFGVVDETLRVSNKNIESKISADYAHLDKQKAILGEEKVKDAVSKAAKLQQYSDEMVAYIENITVELLREVDKTEFDKDGNLKTVKTIESKDNYDKPTNYFINMGKATEFKNKLIEYRTNILNLVDDKRRDILAVAVGLNIENEKYYDAGGEEESWENHNFYHLVMAACVTLLNKTIGEVRNAESAVLKEIISSITAEDFKFDEIAARTIPKSHMIFTGDSYEADIIVAAYDSKQTPEVFYKIGVDTLTEAQLSGATPLVGEEGVVKLKLPASSIGEQRFAGLIKITAPDGSIKHYGFSDKYMVVKPTATIAAEKMNVLYAAIPNPISVSAPVPPERMRVSFPGCNATSTGGGKYDVTVPESMIGKPITISVSADMGGKVQPLGGTEFRVKRVPDPTSYIGGNIYGGKRSKQELLANPFLSARMGEDFAYDLRWTINSYRVTFVTKGIEDPPIACAGGGFSDAVKTKINNAGSNTIIQFTDIRATSIAGQRTLRDLMVRIR